MWSSDLDMPEAIMKARCSVHASLISNAVRNPGSDNMGEFSGSSWRSPSTQFLEPAPSASQSHGAPEEATSSWAISSEFLRIAHGLHSPATCTENWNRVRKTVRDEVNTSLPSRPSLVSACAAGCGHVRPLVRPQSSLLPIVASVPYCFEQRFCTQAISLGPLSFERQKMQV